MLATARRALRPLTRGLLILVMMASGVVQPAPLDAATPTPQQPVSSHELDAMLDVMAARAASLLREHQIGGGFWLTWYTAGPVYEAPRQELNTYLTSVLVDLLSPIAGQRGLDDVVERARRYLGAQIEGNGLVRYHGLPDGPAGDGLGGCAITPDADDTALVWRIAGPGADDPRQQRMLGELARYRDARGLYRTWLAPQAEFHCINPEDPNLPDIGIQLHVYLLLRELDPPAAQRLCAALQSSGAEETLWVYYADAPLVPYLRIAEVQRLDCAIPLPEERLARVSAGQTLWSEAARRLVDTQMTPPDTNAQREIRALLAHMGGEDFALLRRSPPMLYHQALLGDRANQERFYWSDDVGYAVWLRLFEAAGVNAEQAR